MQRDDLVYQLISQQFEISLNLVVSRVEFSKTDFLIFLSSLYILVTISMGLCNRHYWHTVKITKSQLIIYLLVYFYTFMKLQKYAKEYARLYKEFKDWCFNRYSFILTTI